MFVSYVCCVVCVLFFVLYRLRPLRRTDHLSRGVLPCVCVCVCVCVCLIMCDPKSSKREGLGRIWIVAPQKNKNYVHHKDS
jgi:hypothetical protein